MGIGVLGPQAMALQSQKRGWASKLQMKSVLKDIFSNQEGLYNTETKSIPNAIYMSIEDSALSETSSATITMLLPIRGAGVYGNDIAIGHEELAETKAMTIYRNNCRKPVGTTQYGYEYLSQQHLGLFKKHIDNLADWNRDEEGLEIRQAILETYGETLRNGDTAAACVPNWNAHVFIAGLGINSQPAYNVDPAIYSNLIVLGMLASGGGSLTPIKAQTLNGNVLSNLSNFALANRIEPLSLPVPGGKGYILTVSELQAMFLSDPNWATNNLGGLYRDITALPKLQEMNWPGVCGAWKDIVIVQDPKAPTVTPTGSGDTYGLTAGYMWHGDTDRRDRTNVHARDVGMLLGKAALWKWVPEKYHMEEQLDDYGKVRGVLIACVRGIGASMFDAPTPFLGTMGEQYSSAVVLFGIPAFV
jgi:hypothetical protein